MRLRQNAFLSAIFASVFLLGACGGGDADSNTDTQSEADGQEASGGEGSEDENGTEDPDEGQVEGTGVLPDVTGGFGEEPEITYPAEPSPALEIGVLVEGDGVEVVAGDLLLADYIGQVWDGETFDNSFVRDEPTSFPIGVSAVIPGWDQGLVGQKVGSRVVLSIPSELGYAQGNPSAGIEVGDTIAFVVDIIDTFGADSAGDPEARVIEDAFDDLPIEITGELGEPVMIEIKDGVPEPSEELTTVLAEGSGEPLEAGTAFLHFAAAFWGDQQPGSTWEVGEIATERVGEGGTEFDELVGIPVGSRVLIQIPGGDGYEAAAAVVDLIGQPRR